MTITIPYYNNPKMLEKQMEYWSVYPRGVWKNLKVIIVDDGSKYPAKDVLTGELPLDIELYRIRENIPWNHGGARNLAFYQADPGWCIMTDMDHCIPAESLKVLLKKELNPNRAYLMARKERMLDSSLMPLGRHIDSYILTRELYWKIGGFNEDFSGYWNGVSRLFRKQLGKPQILEDVFLHRYNSNVVKDANVSEWGRGGSEYDIKNNKELFVRFNKQLRKYTPEKSLRFSWGREI